MINDKGIDIYCVICLMANNDDLDIYNGILLQRLAVWLNGKW